MPAGGTMVAMSARLPKAAAMPVTPRPSTSCPTVLQFSQKNTNANAN